MKHTILVVDDDPNVRILLCDMLEFRGFIAIGAEDGEEALQKIQEKIPDALVLDVMMPKLDGITVCKQLRGAAETAELPIIMLSGKVQEEDIREGLQAGATKYLCKPIPMAVLIDEIRQVLVPKN